MVILFRINTATRFFPFFQSMTIIKLWHMWHFSASGERRCEFERGWQRWGHSTSRGSTSSHALATSTTAGCPGRWPASHGSRGSGSGQEKQLVYRLFPGCTWCQSRAQKQKRTDTTGSVSRSKPLQNLVLLSQKQTIVSITNNFQYFF